MRGMLERAKTAATAVIETTIESEVSGSGLKFEGGDANMRLLGCSEARDWRSPRSAGLVLDGHPLHRGSRPSQAAKPVEQW